MATRTNVSPSPLSVSLEDEGVTIDYLDGRIVHYRGPIEEREETVVAPRTLHVHVLVYDTSADEGIMVYVNDLDTDDAILESTGVGRVLLDEGDRETIYPGVIVERTGERIHVSVSDLPAETRVYAFLENERGERAVRLTEQSE